ncbi:MAG: 5-carboxymethyl-2-hydroxymuconate isomerase, partial [Polaromonas sp.]|nr:5-carboxymethyl-2-hydroxymuconate isomerase [Polaromonas sp.]
MKLLSFNYQGRNSWGAVVGDAVADLGRAYPQYPTLQAYIAAGRVPQASADAASVVADIPLAAIVYLPVITEPEKIICAIRNYHDHH